MIALLQSGGYFFMVSMILLSIAGLATVLKKIVYFLKNERKVKEYVKEELAEAVVYGDKERAIEICETYDNSTFRVLEEVIKAHDFDYEPDINHLEEKAREAALDRVPKLEDGMWLISLVGHVAPLLGLLGTVTGMIKAFRVIASVGTGNPEMLADGISQALITTAAGLTVAIPAIIVYNYLNKRIDEVITDIEKSSVELINLLRK